MKTIIRIAIVLGITLSISNFAQAAKKKDRTMAFAVEPGSFVRGIDPIFRYLWRFSDRIAFTVPFNIARTKIALGFGAKWRPFSDVFESGIFIETDIIITKNFGKTFSTSSEIYFGYSFVTRYNIFINIGAGPNFTWEEKKLTPKRGGGGLLEIGYAW